jgi:cation diffusion facilitator family transporter
MMPGRRPGERIALFGVLSAAAAAVCCGYAALNSNSVTLVADLLNALLDLAAESLAYATFRLQRSPRRHRWDYGVGKVENLASLFIGVFIGIGALTIAVNACRVVWAPQPLDGFGIRFGIVTTTLFGVFDAWLWWRWRADLREESTPIVGTQLRLKQTDVLVAAGVVTTLLLAQRMYDPRLAYLDALTAVLIGGFVAKQGWTLIHQALRDVLDYSIADPLQMVVNKHLAAHFDGYEILDAVRSRTSGADVFIDIELGFRDGRTMAEIQPVIDALRRDIEADIPGGHVRVVSRAIGS